MPDYLSRIVRLKLIECTKQDIKKIVTRLFLALSFFRQTVGSKGGKVRVYIRLTPEMENRRNPERRPGFRRE